MIGRGSASQLLCFLVNTMLVKGPKSIEIHKIIHIIL